MIFAYVWNIVALLLALAAPFLTVYLLLKLRRFCLDVHRIADALDRTAVAGTRTRSWKPIQPPDEDIPEVGRVANSMFGR